MAEINPRSMAMPLKHLHTLLEMYVTHAICHSIASYLIMSCLRDQGPAAPSRMPAALAGCK